MKRFIAIGAYYDPDNESVHTYHWGLLAEDGQKAQQIAEQDAQNEDWLKTQFDGEDHPAHEGLEDVYVIDPDEITYEES